MIQEVSCIQLFVRPDSGKKGGGDLIQATAYADALRNSGLPCKVIFAEEEIVSGAVLHVFNLDRPWDALWVARAARRFGNPVVLSPILHPREAVLRYQRERSFVVERILTRFAGGATGERLKAVARLLQSRAFAGVPVVGKYDLVSAQKALWSEAAGVQLLSLAEESALRARGFSFTGKAKAIIPNGVPQYHIAGEVLPKPIEHFISIFPKFILMGGRIEPRKNQLSVLRARAIEDIPIVLAGQVNSRHKRYCALFFDQIRQRKNALYVGAISQRCFGALLRKCHVHVSVSLFEVSPLVDLEAMASGAWVVATRESYGLEYLNNSTQVCDPWCETSIVHAIRRQWDRHLRAPLADVPRWDEVGTPLIALYNDSLKYA